MSRSRHLFPALLLALAAVFVPAGAHAYIGPGGIISGLGALLAAVAAVGAALAGFFWFPLKRLYRKIRRRDREEEAAGPATPGV